MIAAVFRTMWLRLWRDRGALLLAFILPGFIFAVFAAIFANASGGSLDLRVAFANESDAPLSVQFSEDLIETATFTLTTSPDYTLDDVRERVRLGQDDVGVVVTGDLADLSKPPITIIQDPAREVAATVLKGQLRQRFAAMSGVNAPELFSDLQAVESAATDEAGDQSVTYYIGATAVLFLLFSAMQGASLSIEERQSGISDRLMVGPGGALAMLSGKFAFLTLIGFVQAAIIVAVAWAFFKVPILDHLPALALACLGSAMLAAGIAVLIAALCGSQTQMHAVSTFSVLLFSAIGGSMVPRFMMPDWLQTIGQYTPNFWSIEAFYGILARGQSVIDLIPAWCVLFGGSLVCLAIAAIVSHRLMRV